MAQVQFLSSVGGDNSIVSDDADPTTGLDNDGHRLRLVPALSQVVAIAGSVANNAAIIYANATAILSAVNSALAAKTQAEAARDQALAGLGAADQSLNLVQLYYAAARAISQAGQANNRIDRLLAYHMQSGEVTITQTANKDHTRSYASASVTLPKNYQDTNYQVLSEVISAVPFLGCEGSIQVTARATNGFVLLLTGSATSAVVRWKTFYPNAK